MTATARPIPESPPVTSATFPESLPAGLYRGASYFGRGSSSASIPGLSSFCFGNGGFGSDVICGLDMSASSGGPSNNLASARGAIGRDRRRAPADDGERGGNRGERPRIERADAEQQTAREPQRQRRRRDANRDADRRQRHRLADDQRHDVAPPGAERDPDRD